MPSANQWSGNYLFLQIRSIAAGIRTSNHCANAATSIDVVNTGWYRDDILTKLTGGINWITISNDLVCRNEFFFEQLCEKHISDAFLVYFGD